MITSADKPEHYSISLRPIFFYDRQGKVVAVHTILHLICYILYFLFRLDHLSLRRIVMDTDVDDKNQ